MIVPPAELPSSEAERLRAFERQGHDALAKSYHAFFSAVTALATNPLLDAVRLRPGTRLLDVASGPGALAAEAANRGARSVGVDLSPRMVELAQRLYPAIEFREADAGEILRWAHLPPRGIGPDLPNHPGRRSTRQRPGGPGVSAQI